jgi:hypothetical protein
MEKYKGNESNAWALIYDQCLAELKNKLEGTQGYDTAKSGNEVAKLLTMICGYCCHHGGHKEPIFFFQKAKQSNADYHEDFMAMLEVIKEYGGAESMTHFLNMLKQELQANGIDLTEATNEQLKREEDRSREVSCCPHAKRSQRSKI